ncbi:uncharacterized protein LOC117228372 isoform X1 [Megalopta genalis]|uniref:uncharacterized protein LOC117228372 isoform X1 n=1 Tax=Megalopta genalis TaxID=115081 RepID=UPI003FD31318
METLYTGAIHGHPQSNGGLANGISTGIASSFDQDGVLSLIVVLGGSLSLVALVFAFITYSLFSDLRSLAGTTLMNLLAALFMVQLLFIVGVGGVQVPGNEADDLRLRVAGRAAAAVRVLLSDQGCNSVQVHVQHAAGDQAAREDEEEESAPVDPLSEGQYDRGPGGRLRSRVQSVEGSLPLGRFLHRTLPAGSGRSIVRRVQLQGPEGLRQEVLQAAEAADRAIEQQLAIAGPRPGPGLDRRKLPERITISKEFDYFFTKGPHGVSDQGDRRDRRFGRLAGRALWVRSIRRTARRRGTTIGGIPEHRLPALPAFQRCSIRYDPTRPDSIRLEPRFVDRRNATANRTLARVEEKLRERRECRRRNEEGGNVYGWRNEDSSPKPSILLDQTIYDP